MSKIEEVSGKDKYPLWDLVDWFAGDVQPNVKNRMMTWNNYRLGILNKWDMLFDRNVYHQLIINYLSSLTDIKDVIEFIVGQDKQYNVPRAIERGWQAFFDDPGNMKSHITTLNGRLFERLKRVIPDIKYTRPEFMDMLGTLGYILYWDHPDNPMSKDMKKYQKDLEKWENKQKQIQRGANLIRSLVQLFVSDDIKDPKKREQEIDVDKDELEDSLNLLDEAVQIAGEVTIGTVTEEFNDGRKIIKDELTALDEQIPFDLSGVISDIDASNRRSINEMEDILLDHNKSIIESIVSSRQAIDTALTEPQSKERQAMEELNMTTGVGFVYALDKFLHKRRVG